jgi:elongation factor Ts
MANIENIKKLRSETSAPLADVKEALEISKDDYEAAKAYLKKKGIAKAEKRSDREANQGVIGSYIHTKNKIGVMVEVNCETDFVAKNEEFQAFAKDVAMQIAAMNPKYVSIDQVPENIKEEFHSEVKNDPKFAGKPEAAIKTIADSKFKTYCEENSLMSQSFFKDGSVTIEEMLKSVSAKLGEAIKIRRFTRMEVGE